jgi:4-amino-4-deoxy-L-arabinose transferase-like glycosyltransferase
VIIALTVVAAALRFATLTHQSLWFDEAQAVHEMRLSFGAMLRAWSAGEPNPPLYFILAWPWAKVFGADAGGLRSLSAVLGTATVPLTYLCGRELVSRRAGLWAAAFTALSPFMIWYSQEAREYMLVTALSAASLVFFARIWRGSGARRDLIWWSVFSALALLTQYFAIFLVAAEAVALLYRRRDRAVGLALIAPVVAVAAVIPHLASHASRSANWIAGAGSLSVRARELPVAFGFSPQYQSSTALSYGLLAAALLLALLIALLIVGADARQLRGAGLAGALAAAVLLIPLVAALAGHDYYVARAMIPAWVPLAVAVGAGCAAARARRVGAALGIILCGLFIYGGILIDTNATYQRTNWRGVADALGPARGIRVIVAQDGTFATAPLAVYLPGVAWTSRTQTPQVSNAPVVAGEVDVVGDAGQTVARRLPAGVRLISSRRVDAYVIARFRIAHPVAQTPAQLGGLAPRLLTGAQPTTAVLVQHRSQ